MIKFSEAQMVKLLPLEKELSRAYYGNYKRSTTYQQNKMVNDFVNEATGYNENRNLNCGSCVLTLFRKAGEIYFNTKDTLSMETEPKDVTPSEPIIKNKPGRKKVAKNVTE